MTNILFSSSPEEVARWAPELADWRERLGVAFALFTDPADIAAEAVDMLVLNPVQGVKDLAPFAGAKAIQSIWAGVESYLSNSTLPQAPTLCRMVDPGLREGMTDYIVAHVMRHHVGLDQHIRDSAAAIWNPVVPPLSRDRSVGVLGLGQLGEDAARRLVDLRFNVSGWSRTPKSIEGVDCRSGEDGLRHVVSNAEILVTILPSTPETRHVLNAETLALAPKGAAIINPGRGALIDDAALLDALAAGRISHATLDVFDVEPLPEDHPYWRNELVTVTPHIAAETRCRHAARVVVEQIRRMQQGETLLHIVDHRRGY